MTTRPAGRGLRDRLSNPRAERIMQIAALAGRSSSRGAAAARAKTGLFLVEGPQGVREVVRFRADAVRDVYASDGAMAAWPEIIETALEAGLFVHPVTDEVAAALSGDSQGIVAAVRTWEMDRLDPAVLQGARLVAVLCDVRDPGNAGTAIRVADAAGADLVILAGDSVDVFNAKVVRASAGSLFHVPVVRGVRVADAVAAAREVGLQVLATGGGGGVELGAAGLSPVETPVPELSPAELSPAETPVPELSPAELSPAEASPSGGNPWIAAPTAWLFGNEAHGLSPDELALADEVVRIPLFGAAESLNLAAAVAVCLYASAFAQHQGT